MSFIKYFVNYPFVVVFLLSALFFLVLSFLINIKIIRNFFVVCCSISSSLLLIEIILSFYMLPYNTCNLETSFLDMKNSFKYVSFSFKNKNFFDRVFFFDLDENLAEYRNKIKEKYDIINEVAFTINEKGLRYTKANKFSPETYLFLGSSYMFGDGVNDKDTLPYIFSERLLFDKNVVNLGQNSKGLNTACFMLESDFLDEMLQNSKVKYIFYEYSYEYSQFSYVIPTDNLIYKDGKKYEVQQPFRLIKKFFSVCLIYERFFSMFVEKMSQPYYINYIQNMFLKMYNISKSKYDADFVVIMWKKENNLEDFFISKKIEFLKIYEYLNYDEDVLFDGHPSAKGNKKICDLVMNYLKSKDVL